MPDDRVVLHTDTQILCDSSLERMFAKARAAIALGQQFTIESHPRLAITVTADRKRIAEAHYAEHVRLATEAENRAGLAATREALEFEDAYAAHVVSGLNEMRARRQTLADMDAQLEGGTPA